MSPKKDGKDQQKPEDRRKGIEESKKPGDKQKEEEITGVTQGALQGLGKIIPGFGELVKGLEKSEAFQERIKDFEADVERELEKATALKRGPGARRSAIPPRNTLKRSGLGAREGIIPAKTGTKYNRPKPGKQARAPLPKRELVAEILDEGANINVIAEMPGLTERTIETQIKDNVLIIKARNQGQQYHEEIELPCPVEDSVNLTYRNGVLQIILNKLKG